MSSKKNENVAAVLKETGGLTKWMKYLGSYPADKDS
jgi:prephenate dehydratase